MEDQNEIIQLKFNLVGVQFSEMVHEQSDIEDM